MREDLREVYGTRVAPLVTAQAGCAGCMLLEPLAESEACAVITMWETQAACEAYEASGAAQEAVSAVKHFFAGPPKLVTYASHVHALRAPNKTGPSPATSRESD